MSHWRSLARIEPRIGIDPKHHYDLFLVDFNAFDQGADDLSLHVEIDCAQLSIDGGCEFFQTIDDQKQLELPCVMLPGLLNLALDLL